MELLRWMGRAFARFVAVIVMILGAFNVVSTSVGLVGSEIEGPFLLLVLFFATNVAGALGGLGYLLSFDGPRNLRTRRMRLFGWGGMLLYSLLPTSLTLMILPMVLVVTPLLPWFRVDEEPATAG
jgi:hypothetical protein